MKKIVLILLLLSQLQSLQAQPDKKPVKQPTSSQPDMNKMLEEAMKAEGMSKEEQEEMKKMMKEIMPALSEVNAKTADYPEFTSNKLLVPKKDPARMTAMARKALNRTEVAAYANGLFAKMMAKGTPEEMAIVKKVISLTPGAADIGNAAVLAMIQGHPQAALALSIKAVATDPANLNWQNNMGALLTSYGYPEQAMPLLKKLSNDMPWNSTVTNNIGQAWLLAGETDSARRYFSAALRSNPAHHESKCGNGLIEELKGDPQKAGTIYEEAMELSVNPFIDQMLKNNKGQKGIENLDFEKIKRNLSIYEYFKKDWIKEPPVLHNNVKYYNEDYGMIKGYQEMTRELGDKIEEMTKTLGTELDELTKKGESEFVKEMSQATMKGLSWMSKPATIVLGVLGAYTKKWHLEYADTLKKITAWKFELNKKRQAEIDAIYKQISDSRGTTCQQFKGQLDKLENDYMQKVNTRLRELLVTKAEEYRQWLNAWCTWNWYVAGNTKNIILMQDINFTQYLTEMYSQIVTAMEIKGEHCSPPVYEVKEKIDAPPIPNFACPTVVHIPSGAEWEGLVAAAKDFDDNKYQIKKTDKPVPNVSVAYGTANQVSQPGIAPYAKTANGSLAPGNINTDDELVPLPKIKPKEHQGSIEKNPMQHDDGQELVPLQTNLLNQDKTRSKLVKDLMNSLMEPACAGDIPRPLTKNDKRVIQLLKEAAERMRKEAEEVKTQTDPKIKRFQQIAKDMVDRVVKELLEEAIERYKEFISPGSKTEIKDYTDYVDRTIEHMRKMERPEAIDQYEKAVRSINAMQENALLLKQGPTILNEIGQNGLQATISTGIQAPGTFNLSKTLFQ